MVYIDAADARRNLERLHVAGLTTPHFMIVVNISIILCTP